MATFTRTFLRRWRSPRMHRCSLPYSSFYSASSRRGCFTAGGFLSGSSWVVATRTWGSIEAREIPITELLMAYKNALFQAKEFFDAALDHAHIRRLRGRCRYHAAP